MTDEGALLQGIAGERGCQEQRQEGGEGAGGGDINRKEMGEMLVIAKG